jgi:hypothetical protein
VAPLFDHGTSLWSDTQNIDNINNERKSSCRSFEGTNEKNILLVKHHTWFQGNNLKDISDLAVSVFQKNANMEKARIEKIAAYVSERSKNIERAVKARHNHDRDSEIGR